MQRLLVSLFVLALFATGCGGTNDDVDTASDATAEPATTEAPTTTQAPATTESPATTEAPADEEPDDGLSALAVPADYATIQDAVDAASPGDLILISPGTYNENVIVETDNLVIRGLDRNEVVLDGGFELENGFLVFSNGVAVENMTIHSYTSNGIFFTGDYGEDIWVEGYRASYITVYNNGLYGIYAFNARNGIFEHSYGSGHPDSAFYIGQCQPCNAIITDSHAENNALGYSGTNAGGNLYVVNSEWNNNRIGIVPNTLDSEELAPQDNIVVIGNYVHDNGNEQTPLRGDDWDLGFGGGILLAGGINNTVERNLVENNAYAGIGSALFVDDNIWPAENNIVRNNVVSGHPFDLLALLADPSVGAAGNCFEGNTFETSIPADIEIQMPCGGEGPIDGNGAPNPGFGTFGSVDYQTMPVPGPQASMPDAETAPAVDASQEPRTIDFDAISVPTP